MTQEARRRPRTSGRQDRARHRSFRSIQDRASSRARRRPVSDSVARKSASHSKALTSARQTSLAPWRDQGGSLRAVRCSPRNRYRPWNSALAKSRSPGAGSAGRQSREDGASTRRVRAYSSVANARSIRDRTGRPATVGDESRALTGPAPAIRRPPPSPRRTAHPASTGRSRAGSGCSPGTSPVRPWKIAVPAISTSAPASMTRGAVSAVIPPSTARSTSRSPPSIISRMAAIFFSAPRRNVWPPNPGLTLITRTRSTSSRTGRTASTGVEGLSAAPARAPRRLISWIVR